MGHPGAGSSAAGGPPAGSVVVPIDIEAAAPEAQAAAPPAPAPAAGARVPERASVVGCGVTCSASITCAASAAAAARPSAWTRLNARLALAAALFLLGCAAAGLAFFAIILPAADSHLLVKACAPATDLRTASEYLLLAASAQVLGATMGLLVPARPFVFLGGLLGWLTGYRAVNVLWMLVSCHGSTTHGALAFHFWLFYAMLCAALPLVGFVISRR